DDRSDRFAYTNRARQAGIRMGGVWIGEVSYGERLRRLDNFHRDIRKLRERFHNRLASKNRSVRELYLDGRIAIALYLHRRRHTDQVGTAVADNAEHAALKYVATATRGVDIGDGTDAENGD